jgi:hemoglobin
MTGTSTLYDRVGGQPFFEALTKRFYEAVSGDPVLAKLYPTDPDALEQARVHLELFLIQYWGGPSTYNEERGHPRLRMRHAPFVIGVEERDAWVAHITEAVRAAGLPPLEEMQLLNYLAGAATQLINSP